MRGYDCDPGSLGSGGLSGRVSHDHFQHIVSRRKGIEGDFAAAGNSRQVLRTQLHFAKRSRLNYSTAPQE